MQFKQRPVTNVKNIALQSIIKYFVVHLLLLFEINAFAAGMCLADKSDISDDMEMIHKDWLLWPPYHVTLISIEYMTISN